MIDVVLCYSILEKCKLVDAFSGDMEIVEMIRRIRQHKMVISETLMDFYEEYFEKKGQEWSDWYREFCTNIFYTKERAVFVNPSANQCYIKANPYQNALVSAALSKETEDHIILMEPKRRISQSDIKRLGIAVFDMTDMKDVGGNNLFSMYTLPVNGKNVLEGEDSRTIAKWMGRFLSKEKYIQIFDSYLLTKHGIGYLKKYILKYIKAGVDIEIYSLKHEEYSEQQIRDEFSEDYYKKWKLSVYLVNSKKTLHARSIQGSNYIIQIERGLSVFGRDGKTFQTLINIFENKDIPRIVLKDSQLTKII